MCSLPPSPLPLHPLPSPAAPTPVVVDGGSDRPWALEGLLVPLNINVGDAAAVAYAMHNVAERELHRYAVRAAEHELGQKWRLKGGGEARGRRRE